MDIYRILDRIFLYQSNHRFREVNKAFLSAHDRFMSDVESSEERLKRAIREKDIVIIGYLRNKGIRVDTNDKSFIYEVLAKNCGNIELLAPNMFPINPEVKRTIWFTGYTDPWIDIIKANMKKETKFHSLYQAAVFEVRDIDIFLREYIKFSGDRYKIIKIITGVSYEYMNLWKYCMSDSKDMFTEWDNVVYHWFLSCNSIITQSIINPLWMTTGEYDDFMLATEKLISEMIDYVDIRYLNVIVSILKRRMLHFKIDEDSYAHLLKVIRRSVILKWSSV
jgi:hypothetical protein